MPEQGELLVARTSCASSAGERWPGADAWRGTNEMLAALYAEIAAALHLPAGTVKSRLAAARDALRQRLRTGNGFRARQETITGRWAR